MVFKKIKQLFGLGKKEPVKPPYVPGKPLSEHQRIVKNIENRGFETPEEVNRLRQLQEERARQKRIEDQKKYS